jgi:hypothetical protein
MKKLLSIIALATTFFVSCNSDKPPPDDGFITKAKVHADSLSKADKLIAKK